MNLRTRIKVCGFTREADVQAAAELGVDAVGFNMWERSARAVSIARAAELARGLPPFVTPVCLFVNASPQHIAATLEAIPHALLQFHGDETPQQCQAAKRPYLRAARMSPGFALLDFALEFSSAAGLVLDTHVEGYGGSGKAFDWSLVPPNVPLPVALSGGLNPANVIDGVMRVRPSAVDVCSGVESAKGIKDAALMRAFFKAVRQADERLAQAASGAL